MHLKQSAALVSVVFNWFWASYRVPWVVLKQSRPLHHSNPFRIEQLQFRFVLIFQISISHIHALLTCFDCGFVFRIKLASFLGKPIGFLWPESYFTMARVYVTDLGFPKTRKIGHQDLYHWTRDDLRNRTMVSNIIYIMCIAFCVLARNIASMESRR